MVHVVSSKGYELKTGYVALKVAEDLYCLARNRTPFLQFAPNLFVLKICNHPSNTAYPLLSQFKQRWISLSQHWDAPYYHL
jgi:hypothetical protein